MQGFGTGMGQTGLYLTGIGIPLTQHPMLCPGVSESLCVRPRSRTSQPGSTGLASNPSPSSLVRGGVDPAAAGVPSKEFCDA